jgi:hypothetical protein
MVTIKANTKQLIQTLKFVKKGVSRNSAKAKTTTCEITVIDGKAAFAVPGAVFSLPCTTQGTCKATVPFLHFTEIIKSSKTTETEITITEGYLKTGIVTISAKTTFFKDDSILRTIDLPINYTDGDILRLSEDTRYTVEELEFNKLVSKIGKANDNLKDNLMVSYKSLKQYGVTYDELADLVEIKLYPKTKLEE